MAEELENNEFHNNTQKEIPENLQPGQRPYNEAGTDGPNEPTSPIETEMGALENNIELLTRRLLPVRETGLAEKDGEPKAGPSAYLLRLKKMNKKMRELKDSLQI